MVSIVDHDALQLIDLSPSASAMTGSKTIVDADDEEVFALAQQMSEESLTKVYEKRI